MIHNYYLKLNKKETRLVDDTILFLFRAADVCGIPVAGTDTIEHAVEALSKAIFASRLT